MAIAIDPPMAAQAQSIVLRKGVSKVQGVEKPVVCLQGQLVGAQYPILAL
jgi:hypothetical protein